MILGVLLTASSACKGNSEVPSDEPRVEPGSFLNEPSGVPPSILAPSYAAISVHAASEISPVRDALNQHFGADITVHSLNDESVRAFLQRYAAWYAPVDSLQAAVKSGSKTLPEASAPLIPGVPMLRAWVPIERLTRQGIHAVSIAGGEEC